MNKVQLDKKVLEYTKGNKSAFDYIYDNTNKIVYFHILYVVKQKAVAEDLLHDTYIKAMQSISAYQQGTSFVAWLMRIGKNLALNYLDKHKRETLTDFEQDSWKYGTTETELPYVVELARKNLKEDEYQIVMMCQVAGYKRHEVAKILDMPLNTVTWKNNQALAKLRQILTKGGEQ